ncbi:MAG: sigma 54-interacting transcriptional regulator, partial [Deltaproteobacteria bacterium]
ELFGHLKGSFTGAIADREGKMEAAEGGTVFLDEIGDMGKDLQGKLLRFLQEREFTPVGGSKVKKVDVRVIAATHVNLEEAVKDDRFREDLYYRLNVIPVTVPPLRERRGDIPGLVGHFLKKYEGESVVIQREAMEVLKRYSWPGNVRELENTVARLLVMRKGAEITLKDLPERVRDVPTSGGLVNMPEDGLSLDELEKEAIMKALDINDWNQSKAARFLKVQRHVLLYRMEKFGITSTSKP